MSSFSGELRLKAPMSQVMRTGQSILEEMGLIFEDRKENSLLFKEKYRFDPYNPVEVEVRMRRTRDGTIVEFDGENMGQGIYQETHVKKMIFDLMDRFEADLGSSDWTPETVDPGIVTELEMLSRLHTQGVLTDVEFERAKRKLLS